MRWGCRLLFLWQLFPDGLQGDFQLIRKQCTVGGVKLAWISAVRLTKDVVRRLMLSRSSPLPFCNRRDWWNIQGEYKKVLPLRLSLLFQQCVQMFAWNFSQPLNGEIYTVLPSLVEICRKVIRLCYFNQGNCSPPISRRSSVVFSSSLLVALKRDGLLMMRWGCRLVFLWQLFPDGLQDDFQLISCLRLRLEFMVLFQHGAPDVRRDSAAGWNLESLRTLIRLSGTVRLTSNVIDCLLALEGSPCSVCVGIYWCRIKPIVPISGAGF